MPNNEDDLKQRINVNETQKRIIKDCLTTKNVPKGAAHWLREFYQKEQIKVGLSEADDNDFIFISDLDEIWDPSIKLNFNFNGKYRLNQKVFTYYLNNRSNENWYGSVGTKYMNIKDYSINHVRTPNMNNYELIPNGGWHFTFQGGGDAIKKKIESYGHQEKNTTSIKTNINNKINSNIDIFGRNFKLWVGNGDMPEYIKNNIEKYKHLIK
jgi:beta-1,4-mannosyl-glycoprotein beta-1,4-N-acetylglucosaminyltransferase